MTAGQVALAPGAARGDGAATVRPASTDAATRRAATTSAATLRPATTGGGTARAAVAADVVGHSGAAPLKQRPTAPVAAVFDRRAS